MIVFKRWFIMSTVILFVLLNKMNAQSLSVGLYPTSILDPITPTLDLAVEYGFHPKWSIEGVYGMNVGVGLFNWISDPDAKHQEYRLMFKYDLEDHKESILNRFIGFDLIGLQQEYERTFDWYQPTSGSPISFDRAYIHRKHFGVRLLGGYQVRLLKGLNVEFISGLGIKRLQIEYSQLVNESAGQFFEEEVIWGQFDRREGHFWRVPAAFGVKLEYSIL